MELLSSKPITIYFVLSDGENRLCIDGSLGLLDLLLNMLQRNSKTLIEAAEPTDEDSSLWGKPPLYSPDKRRTPCPEMK